LPETIPSNVKSEDPELEEELRREKCVVCGEPASPNSKESLCWVCRRLKISAWSDSDNQAPVQE
jgi:hypothetical protein